MPEPFIENEQSINNNSKGVEAMSDYHNAFQAFLTGGEAGQPAAPPTPEQKSPPDGSNNGLPPSDAVVGGPVAAPGGLLDGGPVAAAGPAEVPSSDKTPSVPVKPIVPPIKLRSPPPPPPIPHIQVKPIKGKVYPATYPPPDRPGRTTNQLIYIKRSIFSAVWNHKFSWPFKKPVDAVALNIPDYHTIIKQPMDLGTIKKRLLNKYYWCAEECKKDFQLIWFNCCLYNKPEQDITMMGKTLEKFFQNKLENMRMTEKEVESKSPVPKKRQIVPPSLKRSFYADEQDRMIGPKKIKPMDFESQIPLSTVGWPHHPKRSTNGGFSESESESESDSESEDDRPTTGLSVNRATSESYVAGVGVGTPLSEQKRIKHHCKYCDMPFISRYVRDMHEKQKHVLNNHSQSFAERKVSVPLKLPIKSATKPDPSALPDKGLQIIPGGGITSGGVIRPVNQHNSAHPTHTSVGGTGHGNHHGYEHPIPHFVDKKHQAVHKQAQRNKAKNLQSVKQSLKAKPSNPQNMRHGNAQSHVISHKMAGNLNGAAETSSSSSIPEELLFPMPDDFPNAIKQDPEPFSPGGSDKGNMCFGAKQSPDSGYISSRGMPMVESPGFPGDACAVSSRDACAENFNIDYNKSTAATSYSLMPGSSMDPRLGTASMRFSSAPSASIRISSATVSASPRLSTEGARRLSTSQMSRATPDRLMDLQEELDFVQPTFPRCLLENGNKGMQQKQQQQQLQQHHQQQQLSRDVQKHSYNFSRTSGIPGVHKPSLPAALPIHSAAIASQSALSPRGGEITGLGGQMPTMSARISGGGRPVMRGAPALGAYPAGREGGQQYAASPYGMEQLQSPRPVNLQTRTPDPSPSPYVGSRVSSDPSRSPYTGSRAPSDPSRSPYTGSRAPSDPSRSPYTGSRAPSDPSRSPYGVPRASPVQSQQSRAPAVEIGGAKLDVLSQTLNGGGKMDVLAGALKETFSDLDFEAFEPEPTLLQNNQTQELKLEDLKHLREEPPPLTAVRGEGKKSAQEDLRDLLDFNYPDVRQIIGGGGEGYSSVGFPGSQPAFQYGDQSFSVPPGMDFELQTSFQQPGESKSEKQQSSSANNWWS